MARCSRRYGSGGTCTRRPARPVGAPRDGSGVRQERREDRRVEDPEVQGRKKRPPGKKTHCTARSSAEPRKQESTTKVPQMKSDPSPNADPTLTLTGAAVATQIHEAMRLSRVRVMKGGLCHVSALLSPLACRQQHARPIRTYLRAVFYSALKMHDFKYLETAY